MCSIKSLMTNCPPSGRRQNHMTICVRVTRNCLSKMKIKVTRSHVYCESGSISQMVQDRHTTNRKYIIRHQFVSFPMTLTLKVIRLL